MTSRGTMDEAETLVTLYECVRVIRKTRSGPPVHEEEDGVWALDESWCDDGARVAAAREAIERQGAALSEFWIGEYERRSRANWDAFYKRNGDHAYRDRHYVEHEFAQALSRCGTLVELGAGVGNGVAPLVRALAVRRAVCLDFSPRAVAMLDSRPDLRGMNFEARVCDVATEPFGEADASADCVTCFFVLSAIAPDRLPAVAAKIARVLKPGGRVLVRDYGRFDHAQLRFAKGRKLADNWYVKSDGTRCFYFETTDLDALFRPHNFAGTAVYVCQKHINRATRQVRRRVFVQADFRKTSSS